MNGPYTINEVKEYAIEIRNLSGQRVVAVQYDGSVEYGEGFTADTAAREFWNIVGSSFPSLFTRRIK